MGDQKGELVGGLFDSVREIARLPECRNVCKNMYGNLVRRIKLLSPLFEELKDGDQELGEEDLKGLELLKRALDSAMVVLMSVNQGSKLCQVTTFGFLLESRRLGSELLSFGHAKNCTQLSCSGWNWFIR